MHWPIDHHCHDDDWQFQRFQDKGLGHFRQRAFIHQPPGVEKDYEGGGREFNSDPLLESYRTCDYCGSIHPEDLYNAFQGAGVTAQSADWKYGWPHKLYVDNIPNPHAGVITVYGSRSGGVDDQGNRLPREDYTGPERPVLTNVKFYTIHLKDLEPEPFAALAHEIEERTGITFERRSDDDGATKLFYRGRPSGIPGLHY